MSIDRTASLPELHQLAVFLKVAEVRSFTGAARLLRRSQPAVSQAIARLEDLYGGDLFERRRGTRLALTPIGRAILPSTRSILRAVDQQMARAMATAQSRAGGLTLGVLSGLADGPLRHSIAEFTSAAPAIRLRVVEAVPEELYLQLDDRTMELIVSALAPDLSCTALTHKHLWEEPLVAVLPRTHDLAGKAALEWCDIAALPILLSDRYMSIPAYRAHIYRNTCCGQSEPHAVSRATLLDMVAIGMGSTILFRSDLVSRNDVVFRPIGEEDAIVPINAIWLKDDRNPLRHKLLSVIDRHRGVARDGALSASPRL